jgi:hypothetical protein
MPRNRHAPSSVRLLACRTESTYLATELNLGFVVSVVTTTDSQVSNSQSGSLLPSAYCGHPEPKVFLYHSQLLTLTGLVYLSHRGRLFPKTPPPVDFFCFILGANLWGRR